MKNIKTVLLVALVAGVTLSGFCQDNNPYSPPSPNASSLLEYANVPVNLYTGTPEINLPITELETRAGSIPISISYHASGIKVQDVASWVGLGWSLNAGGVVTRVVKGLPDESANGYCGPNGVGNSINTLSWSDQITTNVSNGTWDGEPDQFFFVFMGRAGKFFLDQSGNAYTMPYSGLSIQSPFVGGLGKWIIKDESGIVYTFGASSQSIETSQVSFSNSSTTYSNTSAWYLETIYYPNFNETITFSYFQGPAISNQYYSWGNNITVKEDGACLSSPSNSTWHQYTTVSISQPKYISRISNSRGDRIDFYIGSSRQDVPGAYYLDHLTLTDYNNTPIKNYLFSYHYFNSDGCSTNLCKRLALDKVSMINNADQIPLYAFSYNSLNLPSRDSFSFDHWGYFNENTSGVPTVGFTESKCNFVIPGNKEPSATYSQANILTKINFANGGYKQFNFESHYYLDTNNSNQLVGGVRIASINSYDGSNTITTNYTYTRSDYPSQSSGQLFRLPKEYYYTYQSGLTFNGVPWSTERWVALSHSVNEQFDINGYHIGYSHVTERVSGKGRTEYNFTNFSDYGDELPIQLHYYIPASGPSSTTTDIGPNDPPYTPYTTHFWNRGVLTSKTIFNESGKRLTDFIYAFNYNLNETKRIGAYKSVLEISAIYGQTWRVGHYYLMTKPITLDKVTVVTYDPYTPDQAQYLGGASNSTAMVTENVYDPITMMITQITTYNQNNSSSKVVVKQTHSNDYVSFGTTSPSPEVAALLKMYSNNEVSTPIEKQVYIEENGVRKMISSTFTKYGIQGSNIVKPVEIWQLNQALDPPGTGTNPYVAPYKDPTTNHIILDARMRKVKMMDSYDQTYGNLLHGSDLSGLAMSYTWGYNNSLVTSVTYNPGISQQQSTSYLHKPLVGVTTITDPNQRTSYFEYDGYSRLKIKRDHDSNILQRYRYHYSMQNEEFSSQFSVSGSMLKNANINFSSTDSNIGFGTTTYSWEFGDGSTSSGTSSSITHSYSSPGIYTVYLHKTNPERNPISVSQQVTIYPQLVLSICADGPIFYDICNVSPTIYGSCSPSSNNTRLSPTLLKASGGGGCNQSYTYSWDQQVNGVWQNYATGQNVNAPGQYLSTLPVGTYTVRCTVTDNCGNTAQATISLQVVKNGTCANQ